MGLIVQLINGVYKMSEKLGAKFQAFLEKEAKLEKDKDDVSTITLGQFKEFAKSEGIPEAVLKQVTEFENEYANGALWYASNKLADSIEAAKKNGVSGEALMKLSHRVKIALPTGKREITVTACKKFPNPQDRENDILKFARVDDETTITRAIDKDAFKSEEERIKKLLGI